MSRIRDANESLRRLVVAQDTPATYAGRPVVETSYVPPQLAGWAHIVWETRNEQAQANIFLGPIMATRPTHYDELFAKNVKAIVNCTTRPNNLEENTENNSHDYNIVHCQVPINDVESAHILPYLLGATTFIHQQLGRHHSVLVHCMAGVSRSATVVLAYLIQYQHMSLNDAYRHVKQRRPSIAPNSGFWAQLQVWEQQCSSNQNVVIANCVPSQNTVNCEWASLSVALFTTFRQVQEMDDYQELCFSAALDTPLDTVLLVALDYVWGQGGSRFAVEWLVRLCEYLSSARTTTTMSNIYDHVLAILEDPQSTFCEQWVGEMHPSWVERVRKALSSAKRTHE